MIKDGVAEGVIAQMAGHTVKVLREEYGSLFDDDLSEIYASVMK